MTSQPQQSPRFIRKTRLTESEYDTNFQKLDRDVIAAVSSPEADQITPLMSKIYLRLIQTPDECRESERVLRFEGETREGKWIKAWDQLCQHLRVSSETANKALSWMHNEGIIGYSAFKNGVGIRIFLNRAASSIGTRKGSGGKKILPFAPASPSNRPASASETAFKDSFAAPDNLDSDLNPCAPKNGADKKPVNKTSSDPTRTSQAPSPPTFQREGRELATAAIPTGAVAVDELIARLRSELEPCVKSVAAQAASQAAAREVAQTRRWFEERALPKAVRVAQHETYDLLRKLGTLDGRRERSDLQVGRATGEPAAPKARPLTPPEITELAETCLALLETQGKKIDVTLSEISAEGGGWLLLEDAPRVREEAVRLLGPRAKGGN